jgi:GDP-L-fucose synthase
MSQLCLKDYFKDDKILVTGASGFVGRNLFDLIQKDEILFHTQDVKCVFMTATKTYGAGIMTKSPEALVTDNIIMNANTLDACYKNKVKKVLFISSSCVYQEAYRPLTEDELDLNKPPYPLYEGVGWVKRYTEQLCKFYSGLGMICVSVRPTNIYGKYDKYDKGAHFIPAIIKRWLENPEKLEVWGKGNSIKNLIYIDDFIRDILKVFVGYDSPEPLNLCSDMKYSIDQIVKAIRDVTTKQTDYIYDETKPDSIPYRAISRNKFDSLLGWEQYTTIFTGMRETVKWMKDELNIAKS